MMDPYLVSRRSARSGALLGTVRDAAAHLGHAVAHVQRHLSGRFAARGERERLEEEINREFFRHYTANRLDPREAPVFCVVEPYPGQYELTAANGMAAALMLLLDRKPAPRPAGTVRYIPRGARHKRPTSYTQE